MKRSYYLDLAASGLRMPIGADLALREKEDVEAIQHDGMRLGAVIEEAARRYDTPLAVPTMDLMLEKMALLTLLDVPADAIPTYHFDGPISPETMETATTKLRGPLHPRLKAHVESVGYIARQTDLLPIGMSIGPFSLMTKLIADPITPVFMAGTGATGANDKEVRAMEDALDLALRTVLRSLEAQLEAGAKAFFVAEPAANRVYFSPKQLDKGADIFTRYVMQPNQIIKSRLNEAGADLLFHCCGELTDGMVRHFTELDPAVLSLGSCQDLPAMTSLVPKTTVLFGNLPSKQFYSDGLITREAVEARTCELIGRMKAMGHPYIVGSECDVLSVPGCHTIIREKVDAMISCACS